MPLSETFCYVLLKEHPCCKIIHTFCEFTRLEEHSPTMCSMCSSLVVCMRRALGAVDAQIPVWKAWLCTASGRLYL